MIDYLNNGNGIYLEGTNIAYDHQGSDFWDMFGAVYTGQGQEHGDVETITGMESYFATGMEFSYQQYSYADIYINRLGSTNGGIPLFRSEEMYLRAIAMEDSVYRTICSTALFGAMSDAEGLSRKVDVMRLYLAFLTNQTAPDIWMSQTDIDFGYVLIDNPKERELIIQNSGLDTLTIDSIRINNDYFSRPSTFAL